MSYTIWIKCLNLVAESDFEVGFLQLCTNFPQGELKLFIIKWDKDSVTVTVTIIMVYCGLAQACLLNETFKVQQVSLDVEVSW